MTQQLSRREFIISTVRAGLAAGGACCLFSNSNWLRSILRYSSEVYAAEKISELASLSPIGRYWVSTTHPEGHCLDCHTPEESGIDPEHSHSDMIVKCLLCAQVCTIVNQERGKCRSRMNVDGELRSLVYGRPITIHVDPIEKKPFYHFLPGAQAYSLATSGCPLHCRFCQNWEISQIKPEDYEASYTPPSSVVQGAIDQQAPVIAFTYNEPTVFIEYLVDIAHAAREQSVRSVLVSCGFMNEAPLAEMCSVLDAIKIDLKGFSETFYQEVCSAELKPVLRSIRQIAKSATHLEIVNLVVPTLNDSDAMLGELCDWVVSELGPDVPVHFTRFHPDYQLVNLSPTPIETLQRARNIALEKGMHYPYVGNVPGHEGNHTYCPRCGKLIIERSGFFLSAMHLKNGRCEFCDEPIAGVWQ
jgi:pyruvate formate lyase activating enzyme